MAAREKLKIVSYGGSNTLMKNGYLKTAINKIKQTTSFEVCFENQGCGNTFSHYGLYKAIVEKEYLDADVVVIEYALNDFELVQKGFGYDWQRAYEGLLRLVRENNKKALIISVILSHKGLKRYSKSLFQHSSISYLTQRYGGLVLDVGEKLEQMHASSLPSDAVYSDRNHYSPAYQAFIGSWLSDQIVENLSDSWALSKLPIEPLDPRAYSNVKFLSLEDAISRGECRGEISCYENSAFSATALELRQGQKLEFSIEGEFVGLISVSTKRDGVLLFGANGSSKAISVYRKAMSGDKFEFLMNNIVFVALAKKFTLNSERNKYSIEVLSDLSASELQVDLLRGSTILPPDADGLKRSFNVVGILYSGDLVF